MQRRMVEGNGRVFPRRFSQVSYHRDRLRVVESRERWLIMADLGGALILRMRATYHTDIRCRLI